MKSTLEDVRGFFVAGDCKKFVSRRFADERRSIQDLSARICDPEWLSGLREIK
jgi:hypothetical protein